ncbi:hypothetical protein QMK61_04445 [Fulvimonas sp. R45]|uniref:hypothetical protein n=1 Tax=Fulvimonas sp. R45 TaxID=3045937 RepID=UPI00265F0571|nr:hypothetical protein [Fulvimonas sp. R45]MDO1528076.1 hypothetical protein [Fulvimonas sp. R45]
MPAAKNPVEKAVDNLCGRWLEASADPELRLAIWRVPGNALGLLAAFVEAQQHAGTAGTPDLFVKFDAPFEAGYRYSRALKDALLDGYLRSRDTLAELGLKVDWDGPFETRPDTAAGFLGLLDSFVRHHGERLRHAVAVLWPEQVATGTAPMAWMEQALAAPVPERIRLVLVDTVAQPTWQPLVERHPQQVCLIETPLDMFDLARATAAQSGAGGAPAGAAAYRQLLTDVMSLLDKRSAADTAQRAERALAIAERQQWPDQQVALHMAVAGAHLKEKQYADAIRRYRRARECALVAREREHPAAGDLLMQGWFGEAGALLAAQQPEHAAAAYAEAAQAAAAIPNPLFVIEGRRMAGYCLARAHQREAALQHGLQGVAAARDMAPADLALTTFPLLLQDLLHLQDARRATQLAKCADDYRKAVADAHAQAERLAAKLGDAPNREATDALDAELMRHCESAFTRLVKEREQLIAGGDTFFRKVVSVGRELLHPGWNGLPDVRHPQDKPVAEWSEPPGYLPLPGGDDLAQTPLDPAPAEPALEKLA